MASAESAQTTTRGTIDNDSVSFRYETSGTVNDAKLTWTDDKEVHADSKWSHIEAADVVRLSPLDAADIGGKRKLLYVEQQVASDEDSKANLGQLKTRVVSGLPHSFLNDFAQTTGLLAPRSSEQRDQAEPITHIIISTGSGTALAESVWERLVQPALNEIGYQQDQDYVVHFTTSETSVSDFAASVLLPQANLGIAQKVMILSGDGGVVDIVNSLLSGERSATYCKPLIAVLPLGTGNALAHSAGITADHTMGLSTWFRGVPKELPLFCATFSPGARLLVNEAKEEVELHVLDHQPVAHGAVVCSWGMHAGLVADSDTAAYRKFGVERFKMAAKEALFPSDGSPPHVYRAKVSVIRSGQGSAGREWQEIRTGEHAYVLATLVSELEKGFRISPAATPLDGQLRLVHFGPMTGEEAMAVMGKAYQGGRHVEDERIGYEGIEALKIEFREDDGRWRRVCIDGKIIRVEKDGWVEVRLGQKGVVDLLVPHN